MKKKMVNPYPNRAYYILYRAAFAYMMRHKVFTTEQIIKHLSTPRCKGGAGYQKKPISAIKAVVTVVLSPREPNFKACPTCHKRFDDSAPSSYYVKPVGENGLTLKRGMEKLYA